MGSICYHYVKRDDSKMEQKMVEKIKTMLPILNEKQRRLYLASEAIAIGHGGIAEVSRASGISRSVISAGIKEIKTGDSEVLSADAPIREKEREGNQLQEHSPELRKRSITLYVTPPMEIQRIPCVGQRKVSGNLQMSFMKRDSK